jgi:hypothetical protein
VCSFTRPAPHIYRLGMAICGWWSRTNHAQLTLGRLLEMTHGSWRRRQAMSVQPNWQFGRPMTATNRPHLWIGRWQVGPWSFGRCPLCWVNMVLPRLSGPQSMWFLCGLRDSSRVCFLAFRVCFSCFVQLNPYIHGYFQGCVEYGNFINNICVRNASCSLLTVKLMRIFGI